MHPNKVGVQAANGQRQGDHEQPQSAWNIYNESSFSGTTVLLHRKIISITTSSYGQCHSNCIAEPDGRQPFPLLIRSGQGSWDVVHQKEIAIYAEHLPGSENIRADWES